jgi:hypothetical protein
MHVVIGIRIFVFPFSMRISPGSLKSGILPAEKCHSRPEMIKTAPITIRDLLVVSIFKLYAVHYDFYRGNPSHVASL